MKEDWIFWGNWSKKEKILFFAFFLCLIGLIAYTFFLKSKGLENVVHWDVVSVLREKLVQTPALYWDKFSFSSTAPLWYVNEYYSPSTIQLSPVLSYIYLAALLLGTSLILNGLSRLRGVWFLVGALLLGGVLVAVRPENLFLTAHRWPFLVAFTICGLTYYFTHNAAKSLNVFKTLGIWIGVWILLVLVCLKFSVINVPVVALSHYGVSIGVLLSMLFMFLCAHEIVSALLSIVSDRAVKEKSSLMEVLIMGLVFLFNALLVYLENSNRISTGSYIPPAFLVFVSNGLLGIWGFRKLSEQKEWFTYLGVGLWVYLGLFLVSLGTWAFAYGTYNTPLIEFLEDFASISALAGGGVFLTYSLLNFWPLIKGGLPFHKVIYKPPFLSFIIARVAALFVIFFLFALKSQYSFYQFKSGLHNAIGDFYELEGDFRSAETYYKSAAGFDAYNQKSNLALASLSVKAKDYVNAVIYYRQAGEKQPNLASILGLSQYLDAQDFYFDALFQLKEGTKLFPQEHKLYTNLAHLQERAGVMDSILVNINQAMDLCPKCAPENANFLAFWIANGKPEKWEEMSALSKGGEGYSVKANRAAMARVIGEELDLSDFRLEKDSLLDVSRAAYLLNSLSHGFTKNEKVTAEEVRKIQQKNEEYFEPLSWAYAMQKYYREDKLDGIKAMRTLGDSPSKMAPVYKQNLGMWLMNEGAYTKAIEFLKSSGDESSAALLNTPEIRIKVDSALRGQSESLAPTLEAVKKAPLNPYVLVKTADALSKEGRKLDAYNLIFYALEFQPDSPLLWRTYVQKALDLSMKAYAEEGLENGSPYLSKDEIMALREKIQRLTMP